jgi:hypothetical protein
VAGRSSDVRYAVKADVTDVHDFYDFRAKRDSKLTYLTARIDSFARVPIVSILFTCRRTATDSMHPTDATAAKRRLAGFLFVSMRLCTEARRSSGSDVSVQPPGLPTPAALEQERQQ